MNASDVSTSAADGVDRADQGALLRLSGVSKTYRTTAGVSVRALDEVLLKIPAGSTVAVMAPSGAGKSTLLHVLGAMDRPDSGSVEVDGVDLTTLKAKQLAAYRREVGFVFQRFHLLPGLSALDNVLAPLIPYRPSSSTRERARELLELVGLGERTRALPSSLSGGQQQRVAIARALIGKPRLLLADEPTGNLDSATGTAVLELLDSLQRESGFTMVMATHDARASEICGRRVALIDGRVVSDDGGNRGDGERSN